MIKYRCATPHDVDTVSKLLLEVSFASRFLYGSTYTQDEIIGKIASAFVSEEGKSSYKNFYVAQTNVNDVNNVIGFVAFYDFTQHKIDEKMYESFSAESLDILSPLYNSIIPQSFYISALIVDARFRNLNIGPQLINHVMNQARKRNRTHVCLHVWKDNHKGIRFYLKNKFTLYDDFSFSTDSELLPPSKRIYLAGVEIGRAAA